MPSGMCKQGRRVGCCCHNNPSIHPHLDCGGGHHLGCDWGDGCLALLLLLLVRWLKPDQQAGVKLDLTSAAGGGGN